VFPLYRCVWERLDKLGANVASHEGIDFAAHEASVRDRGDFPVRLDTHLTWLRGCSFAATALHVHGNRALVAGIKSDVRAQT
jgi:hypothetical protein